MSSEITMNRKNKKPTKPRKPHQKKPIAKGVKSMRGKGEHYDETKKITSIAITPTARAELDALSEKLNISLSELIERFARGLIKSVDIAASS